MIPFFVSFLYFFSISLVCPRLFFLPSDLYAIEIFSEVIENKSCWLYLPNRKILYSSPSGGNSKILVYLYICSMLIHISLSS